MQNCEKGSHRSRRVDRQEPGMEGEAYYRWSFGGKNKKKQKIKTMGAMRLLLH